VPSAELASNVSDSHELIAAAVTALPLPTDDTGRRWNLNTATVMWIRSRKSDHTRRAYYRELSRYLTWCAETGLDPRHATRADIDLYTTVLTERHHLGDTSTVRALSAVSSWYHYLETVDATPSNPVRRIDRPKIDRDRTPTIGLTNLEATALLAAADADGPRTSALLALLVGLGIRVAEACGADLADLGHADGHRTLTVRSKGRKERRRALPPQVGATVDAYLAHRAATAGVTVDQLSGPLFTTRSGRRLDQPAVFRLLRRTAKAAGIESWNDISPHSLRHTWNTIARERGADLDARQDALAHADPRTTRRYDRSAHRLDTDPAYLVAAATASGRPVTCRVEAATPSVRSEAHAEGQGALKWETQ
jgi:integrase/recombinase XerD